MAPSNKEKLFVIAEKLARRSELEILEIEKEWNAQGEGNERALKEKEGKEKEPLE